MNQNIAKPSHGTCRAPEATESLGSVTAQPNEQDRLRQELLRMILKHEAQRKQRFMPHLDLNAPRPAAENRIDS